MKPYSSDCARKRVEEGEPVHTSSRQVHNFTSTTNKVFTELSASSSRMGLTRPDLPFREDLEMSVARIGTALTALESDHSVEGVAGPGV